MKKSLIKNSFKEISKTKRRFLSILIMAFLGVGFYSGLVACSPDMQDSLDKYVDKSNMYDIDVISTLGLTDEDIKAIKETDGVENAYGIQSKDTFINLNDKESICTKIYLCFIIRDLKLCNIPDLFDRFSRSRSGIKGRTVFLYYSGNRTTSDPICIYIRTWYDLGNVECIFS